MRPELLELLCSVWDALQQWTLWWPHLPCVAFDPRAEWLADASDLWVPKRPQLFERQAVRCRHRVPRLRLDPECPLLACLELRELRPSVVEALELSPVQPRSALLLQWEPQLTQLPVQRPELSPESQRTPCFVR